MPKSKIRAVNPFRIEVANDLYNINGKENSWCAEYGIDVDGNIYFHYLNGVTERHTRTEFIKLARKVKEETF